MISIEQAAEAYELITHYGMSHASTAIHMHLDDNALRSKLFRLKRDGYKKTIKSRVKDVFAGGESYTCKEAAIVANISELQTYRAVRSLTVGGTLTASKEKHLTRAGSCYRYCLNDNEKV